MICLESHCNARARASRPSGPCCHVPRLSLAQAPLGGLARKLVGFVEGGQSGNREEGINALAQRML